jgi:hypothetical protein
MATDGLQITSFEDLHSWGALATRTTACAPLPPLQSANVPPLSVAPHTCTNMHLCSFSCVSLLFPLLVLLSTLLVFFFYV